MAPKIFVNFALRFFIENSQKSNLNFFFNNFCDTLNFTSVEFCTNFYNSLKNPRKYSL